VSGLVVELAGLPGSGKSTLADALAARLRADGLGCEVGDAGVSARVRREVRVLRRLALAASQTAHAPLAAARSAGVVARSGQSSRRDVAAVLAQWLATERIVARGRRASGVRLLEEGLVQTTWTALLRSDGLGAADLWPHVPAASRPHLVLHLDVPPDLAAHRLASRASRHSRVQRLGPRKRAAELRRGQQVLDDVLHTCPVRVHRLSSYGETADELAVLAAEAVHALVDGLPTDGPTEGSDLG
jgi:thymidylate kinase